MIKPEVKTVLYPEVRHLIEVGDFIGCRGGKLISRLIRMFRGGVMNMSHAAIIVESSKSPSERVKVFEALGGPGMVRTLLTDAYEHDHGEIFWAPMKNNELEQDLILDEIERIELEDIKYDYGVTFLAIFKRITLDIARFNCSELFWHLQRYCGRVAAVWNKKKKKEVAPCPGNCIVKGWANCPIVYRLIFAHRK